MRLIHDWRRSWRFHSLRFGALALVTAAADVLQPQLGVLMPELPAGTLRALEMLFLALSIGGRVIQQNLSHEEAQDARPSA